MERLVIDDTTVYEIDEECERARRLRREADRIKRGAWACGGAEAGQGEGIARAGECGRGRASEVEKM